MAGCAVPDCGINCPSSEALTRHALLTAWLSGKVVHREAAVAFGAGIIEADDLPLLPLRSYLVTIASSEATVEASQMCGWDMR